MFTYIAPQASYSASAALCVTDRTGIQPRPQSKPALALADFALYSHAVVYSPSLLF